MFMEKLQINLRKHKKLFGVLGLVFIVCLECCVFPVGSFSLGGDRILVFINFATAIGISKCLGEIEAFIFPKVTWLWIFILNFGITILGMIARYFLEYGEVSNTYNFNLKNIVVHMVIMMGTPVGYSRISPASSMRKSPPEIAWLWSWIWLQRRSRR